ncbi:ribonucleotide-diphosphate reductase subunit beta, partial [Lactobacillus taiwanensis]|uniref:ribonucleotide-diphosphate reductase subunit beta n=1 Tax=Lactobacillus taiwanensis TaxID=508451 RepID=UPI0028FC7C75
MLLHSFVSLTISSTLQMKVALSKIKEDAENSDEEAAVYNTLQYLESINNKAYGLALNVFDSKEEQLKSYEWVNNTPNIQNKMNILTTVKQANNTTHK